MSGMAYLNGRLPGVALGNIHNGRLRRDAARAWNAMNMEASGRHGVVLTPTGSMSSYRTLGQQQYLWNLWKSGRGNLAAVPGTSNHGWGLAVDLASPRMRTIVDEIGEKYGFAKRWSDAQSEWWHIKWRYGIWNGKASWGYSVVSPGQSNGDVLRLKQAMYKKGLRKFSRVTPKFGPSAVAALKRFQRAHHMKADGIAGPKTWHALNT